MNKNLKIKIYKNMEMLKEVGFQLEELQKNTLAINAIYGKLIQARCFKNV